MFVLSKPHLLHCWTLWHSFCNRSNQQGWDESRLQPSAKEHGWVWAKLITLQKSAMLHDRKTQKSDLVADSCWKSYRCLGHWAKRAVNNSRETTSIELLRHGEQLRHPRHAGTTRITSIQDCTHVQSATPGKEKKREREVCISATIGNQQTWFVELPPWSQRILLGHWSEWSSSCLGENLSIKSHVKYLFFLLLLLLYLFIIVIAFVCKSLYFCTALFSVLTFHPPDFYLISIFHSLKIMDTPSFYVFNDKNSLHVIWIRNITVLILNPPS